MKIRYIINRYEITNWFIITQLTQPFHELCRFPGRSHMFMNVTNSYCCFQTWCSNNVLMTKFLKKRKGYLSTTKPKLQLALENGSEHYAEENPKCMKFITDSSVLESLQFNVKWGKPSTEEHNMRVRRKCMYNLSTYPLMVIHAHNPNEHITSIFHFYVLQNSWLTHIMS